MAHGEIMLLYLTNKGYYRKGYLFDYRTKTWPSQVACKTYLKKT